MLGFSESFCCQLRKASRREEFCCMATLCHEVMRCTCSVDSPPDTSILTCETLAVNESGDARNHNPGLSCRFPDGGNGGAVRAESRAAAWPFAHVCSIQYVVPEPRSTQSSDRCAGDGLSRRTPKVRRAGDNPWCETREQDDMIITSKVMIHQTCTTRTPVGIHA